MVQSDIMWDIFMATGNVEAYLLYLDYARDEGSQDESVSGGVLDM